MNPLLSAAFAFGLACHALAMLLTFARLLQGPTAQDRVLALDYLYTNGLLATLVLGMRYQSTVYFEIALLIAALGFIGSMALAKFLLRGEVIE